MKKKLGFVDLYLDEWHANNYPKWLAQAAEETGLPYELAYAYGEKEPENGRSSEKWCRDLGVEKCESAEELCEKCDAIYVLAPSNPEAHLPLAKKVLPFGKPTFIDKTFAPNLTEAKEIFAIAGRYGTPFFSSSALRYASELDGVTGVRGVTVTGSGSNLPEYFIHMAEMATKLLHDAPKRVKAEKMPGGSVITGEYADGRTSVLVYGPAFPYTFHVASESGYAYKTVTSAFFPSLLKDTLRFFEEKTVSFDVNETLNIMRYRDAALKSYDADGAWTDTED